MKHPAYQLRPNKAVDRLSLIEVIRRLDRIAELSEFTYYGMGGPYLEEFRLLYEHCPQLKLVSIEHDQETFKRQAFHKPCGTVELKLDELSDFISNYSSAEGPAIFWLDYTDLKYSRLEDFSVILQRAAEYSLVKITLRCQPRDYYEPAQIERFRQEFGKVMPDVSAPIPRLMEDFALLIQSILRIAAEQALRGSHPLTFTPLSSFHYADSVGMYTLTGILSQENERSRVLSAFSDLDFLNKTWKDPVHIDVPILSTKERLHLEGHLPCLSYSGRTLRKALGYLVDNNSRKTDAKLANYAKFHRYYPYFMKAAP